MLLHGRSSHRGSSREFDSIERGSSRRNAKAAERFGNLDGVRKGGKVGVRSPRAIRQNSKSTRVRITYIVIHTQTKDHFRMYILRLQPVVDFIIGCSKNGSQQMSRRHNLRANQNAIATKKCMRFEQHTTDASMKAYSKAVLPCRSCCCKNAAFLTFSYKAICTAKSSGRCSSSRVCK